MQERVYPKPVQDIDQSSVNLAWIFRMAEVFKTLLGPL